MILLLGICLKSNAQDIHFSQFLSAPYQVNPALTGDFLGDYRFVSNYRNQWSSVTVPYQTFAIGGDLQVDWLNKKNGAGFNFLYDKAGDSRFTTTELNFNFGVPFYLSRDSLQSIRFGVQTGITNRVLDYSALRFDNQFNGYAFDPNLPINESFLRDSRTYLNLNAGISYKWKRNSTETYNLGISLLNIISPQQSYFDIKDIKLDKHITSFISAEIVLNEQYTLIPAVLFMNQGRYRELTIGSNLRYRLNLNNKSFRALKVGAWYRNSDAGFVRGGIEYENWDIGLSYDINLSGLKPASNGRGGFEISVIYILTKYRPDLVQRRICPNYI